MADNRFPDRDSLKKGLAEVLGERSENGISILNRQMNPYTSSFMAEIVTCRLLDGRELGLLIKYGPLSEGEEKDYRGSVEFEAAVYRDVLQALPLTKVDFYGVFTDKVNDQTGLVIAHLPEALRIIHDPRAEQALVWSAGWIGSFHAINSKPPVDSMRLKLGMHSPKFYLDWARKAEEFTRPLLAKYPWLPAVSQGFEGLIPALTTGSQTIIHGEYYAANILVEEEKIYPVDWQTTAVARGEVDLASLIEGWEDDQLVQRCLDEYCMARWKNGPPPDFSQALSAALVYWSLKWLGYKPEWTVSPDYHWRFELLRLAGERAGLI